jgi:hypothetical protein
MRKWKYVEPKDPVNGDWSAHDIVLTENEILQQYYPRWVQLMIKAGKTDLITPANCIEDFVVVNWAEEVK